MFRRRKLVWLIPAVYLAAPIVFLTGCGGRVSRPVEAVTAYDGLLDCEHLQAEKEVNRDRARGLTGEQKLDTFNSLGLLIMTGPIFLNLKDSEKTELRAFAAREQVLDGLIAKKGCTGANTRS